MCQKRVKLREETNADFCHSLLENPHPERQQEQLVASLHGKPNSANPGKFSLGEGGRDPDDPGSPPTCAGPGWSRIKAQEKVIKALSSLFFPGSDTRYAVGHFSLLSAEEIKNNELLAHPPHTQTCIYIRKLNPWVGKAKHIQWIYVRLLTKACLKCLHSAKTHGLSHSVSSSG